ncbi:zinc ribbon domain-containing protein [Aeromicrobium phragmitis]|uniref:Zinc ribbon domain-containing protein n=1 Tax=Aeromicrobium phragmitis TaxID=2478914 RepID=A0A3L8PK01_9ACTN|nr:FmdB family zinc ribbon protein [Aeromicrobium phragmitis]RLV55109.1 zinc ribbon domain-containing protein [Aeromicrobium phragmitis]
MPMYQYQCSDCTEGLEVRQSFSDAALTECPSCGGRLRKVFGSVGVVFKGSGFYRNDSRSDSSTSSSTGSATSSTSSSSSTASSSTSGDSPAA